MGQEMQLVAAGLWKPVCSLGGAGPSLAHLEQLSALCQG